jgi:hypothetical protein
MDAALLPEDTIRLRVERARFHGMEIDIQGTVTNFTALRDWGPGTGAAPASRPPSTNPPPEKESGLRQFAAVLGKIHFTSPPRLSVRLGGDGSDLESLWTRLSLNAGGTQTPWGRATGLRLAAAGAGPMSPGPGPFLKIRLSAGELTTPRASARNVELSADLSRAVGTNLDAVVSLSADNCQGRWLAGAPTNDLRAARLRWNGSATLRPSPWGVVAATGTLRGEQVGTLWGSAASASVTCAVRATGGSPAADASWGLWAGFNPWAADWQADLKQVEIPKLTFGRIQCAGRWRAPDLELTNLDVALYGGEFAGRVGLDVASRELRAAVGVDFDAGQVSQLLTPSARRWMGQIQWDKPPKIAAGARLVLPDWTNPAPDWWGAVLPSLQIAGCFSTGPVSYRDLRVSLVQSTFTYSNEVWNLPRLRAVRPEGDLLLDYTGSEATGDYRIVADWGMDPGIVRPLLPPERQSLLDEVSFTEPPQIHAEASGRWGETGRTTFTAQLTATNFTGLGEKIDRLAATVDYTNLLARFTDGQILQDGGRLEAPLVEADFAARKISLSNVVSTLEPGAVLRVLGPVAPGWLRSFRFDTPPTVGVTGSFVPGDPLTTDLRFTVDSRSLRQGNLSTGPVSGQVHWTARRVAVTNVSADLYGGTLKAWGFFDYGTKEGTDFRGSASLAKIQLPLLMRAWSTKSNNVEGALDAEVSVAGGNTEDEKSWRATGKVLVSQARLWDIKIFGIFSPVLNAIVPGSGDSRAYRASADFVVTNALLVTDNLEIRSTGFRLNYHGTLDSKKHLDARAEALLLRNTPVFGSVISFVFSPLSKLFEYKIGGTLDAPTFHPIFIHNMLHPFQMLKNLLPPETPATPPAAPPAPPNSGK